jgi:hypothetical protein
MQSATLNQDGPQHATAIVKSVEVTHSVDSGVLEAGDLGHF